MLLHRIRGLWNAYHGFLAVVLTVVFWTYLVFMTVVFRDITEGYPRFILYNLAGIVGLVISAIRGRSMAARLLAGGFVECHTLALKQTVYVGVTILVVVVAAMDPEVSRVLQAVTVVRLFGHTLRRFSALPSREFRSVWPMRSFRRKSMSNGRC